MSRAPMPSNPLPFLRRLFPERRSDIVALLAICGMTAGLGVMLWRVYDMQTNPSPQLVEHMGARQSRVTEIARRGDLTDRRGRPLAATRFGVRVFVDPAELPHDKLDEVVVKLADATGLPATELGPKIIQAMLTNERRQAAIDATKPKAEPPESPLAKLRAKILGATHEAADQRTPSSEADTLAMSDAGTPEPIQPDPAQPTTDQQPLGRRVYMPGEEVAATEPKTPKLIRYMPITGVLDESRVDLVKKLKIPGVHLENKQVREVVAEDLTASLLGKVGAEDKGLMGTEMKLDEALQPKTGSFAYTRDSRGRPLWVKPDSYTPAQDGTDLKLSLDLELQRIVLEELERGVAEAEAAGGRAVMMDPNTGEVLAMADIVRDLPGLTDYNWETVIPKDNQGHGTRYRTIRVDPARQQHPALGRNRCVEDIYEPGSTFKPFMWATVTAKGLMRPRDIVSTHGGIYRTPYGRVVTDVLKRGTMDWQEVLINSSNIGMTQGVAKLSFEEAHNAIKSFGFGTRPGTGLPGETPGLVTPLARWSNYTQTSVSSGYEVAVTPVQVARAFCSISRKGPANGTLPPVRMAAWEQKGSTVADTTVRVLPQAIADLTRDTLRGVTASLDRRLAAKENPEEGWQYELFGKSGTAEIPLGQPPEGKRRPKGSDGYFSGQYNSSFVAGGPVDSPRLVLIVVIDDPGPELVRTKNHRGAAVAGPVVRRAMERSLLYLGVPPSPPMSEDVKKREQH